MLCNANELAGQTHKHTHTHKKQENRTAETHFKNYLLILISFGDVVLAQRFSKIETKERRRRRRKTG